MRLAGRDMRDPPHSGVPALAGEAPKHWRAFAGELVTPYIASLAFGDGPSRAKGVLELQLLRIANYEIRFRWWRPKAALRFWVHAQGPELFCQPFGALALVLGALALAVPLLKQLGVG